ncbi:lysophospholipid acyltransferase family protein [Sulfurimonas gotlandica]|nr:lysophospholipid acyltransferase family protein [Sulfurimonas gotlandica]EDZ63403.1 1-acyl-sn-glycerol-3-phosphate acyltransferase 1, putative [Sulfurimonas gotlandica GD1]
MRLGCIASSFAFILFFGLIGLFVIPSLLIYGISYPFVKYPQDRFQYLSSVIYKIFFFSIPRIKLDIKLLEELPKSAVYVSTHQSNLDYPILGYFIQKYLIMTTMNFKKIPFISQVGHLIGIRHLDKNNLGNISDTYGEFEQMLQEDRNVVFFAEGTRGSGKGLGRFKKGAFRLAMKTNKPIIPIVIDGSADILAKGNFCFSGTKKANIKVQMLEPIYPDKFSNESDMLKYTHNIMSESCQK